MERMDAARLPSSRRRSSVVDRSFSQHRISEEDGLNRIKIQLLPKESRVGEQELEMLMLDG